VYEAHAETRKSTYSHAHADEWTGLDLSIHTIRNCLANSLKAAECSTVTDICCKG
jgi:hypothetical protein